MNKHSYEATIEVDDEKIKGFINDLFGDKGEYENRQKRFGESATSDALSFFHNRYALGDASEDIIRILENIAVSMYFRGFNRAFEYYVKHEDIFNLENNENTKQD